MHAAPEPPRSNQPDSGPHCRCHQYIGRQIGKHGTTRGQISRPATTQHGIEIKRLVERNEYPKEDQQYLQERRISPVNRVLQRNIGKPTLYRPEKKYLFDNESPSTWLTHGPAPAGFRTLLAFLIVSHPCW
jgi:hypothetical protein